MSAPGRTLALDQIQALLVNGYKHNHCRYFILTVQDAAAARRFFAGLVEKGWVEGADKLEGAATRVSVGLSFPGLRQLGLKRRFLDVLQTHAGAFYEGAPCRSANRLADTGASAARYWDARFERHAAHVLLAVHGDSHTALDAAQAQLQALAPGAFMAAGWQAFFEACHLKETIAAAERRTVHFGFVDGISKVFIKGVPKHDKQDKYKNLGHEPGEFFLGYPNDKGYNPWLLANARPDHALPPRRLGDTSMPERVEPADFFRNGSFAAFRDMAQDEKAFRTYTDARAAEMGVSGDYLRAKMLGRWQEGEVVRPGEEVAPVSKDRHPATLDDFDFSQDAAGEGCPFGAHVRRMNPRADGVVPFRRRPLIRRGLPYGPVYVKGEKEGIERGLLGLFFCASLEDQFEHLLAEWGDANPMGTPNQGKSKDPLIGNHTQAKAPFDIPVAQGPLRQLDSLTPFVTTRGTLYLLFPGLDALRAMGRGDLFDPKP